MTGAYVPLDSNAPDGATSPTIYSGKDLANVRALRDMVVAGRVAGFLQFRTQGTGPDVERSQYIGWLNSSLGIGFRWKLVWGGTGNVQVTSAEWEWTSDNGAGWVSLGTAQANTYDANNNITATTNSGGWYTMLFELWTKFINAGVIIAAHIAGTGAAVHGLGNMSTQAKTAVDIDGGTADGLDLGGSVTGNVDAKRVREEFHDYGTIAAAGTVTIEWDKYAAVRVTPNATTSNTMTFAFSGLPASGKFQSIIIEVINGLRSADGKYTYPGSVKFSPSRLIDTAWEAAGRNFFLAWTVDGGTRVEWQHIGKGG